MLREGQSGIWVKALCAKHNISEQLGIGIKDSGRMADFGHLTGEGGLFWGAPLLFPTGRATWEGAADKGQIDHASRAWEGVAHSGFRRHQRNFRENGR